MHFQIGQMYIQASVDEQLIVVVPIGEHVIAAKVELFRLDHHNSIKVDTNIYHKTDAVVTDVVQRWCREAGA